MINPFRDRAKFLVQWIEQEGLVRGQVSKNESEAIRMFNWVVETKQPILCEIRLIGSLLSRGNRTYYYKGAANSAEPGTVENANG